MSINCPHCGKGLHIAVEPASALNLTGEKSRPAKSEYAIVRPTVPATVPKAPAAPKIMPSFRTDNNVGRVRQAFANAGVDLSGRTIYHDRRVGGRRIKIYNGNALADMTAASVQLLDIELKKMFGDRLISHGTYVSGSGWRGDAFSYVIKLTD